MLRNMKDECTPKTETRDVLGRKMNPRYRFPFIMAAAKELKVSRMHLYFVLTGHRPSERLTKGYERIKKRMEGGR